MPIKIEIPDAGDLSATECRALRAMFDVLESNYGKIVPIGVSAEKIADGLISKSIPLADDPMRRTAAITPEDNPAVGIDTDATLQAAGFGGNVAGGTETAAVAAAVPVATIAPPAPPATLPAPPVTATAPTPSGNVQLDKRGLPWDHRIHSSEKTQNKDGSWRNKRGLPDGEVERVETELRAVLGIAAPEPARSLQPAPAWPFPASSTSVAPPAPPSPPGAMGFMQLLPKVTGAIKAGTLTQDAVNATLVEFSLPNLPAIHHRPDLVQPFHDRLFGAA